MAIDVCCENCKTGKAQLDNYNARKKKTISRKEFTNTAIALGQVCIRCFYNQIKGLKSNYYKSIYPDFQTLDLFEQIEKINGD